MASNFPVSNELTLTSDQHMTLLAYLMGRVRAGYGFRDRYSKRWEYIDREINSYIKLTGDDEERDDKNKKGHGVTVVNQKSGLIFRHMYEALTYLSSVLAPDTDMYEAVASKDKMSAARSFTGKMNKDAQIFAHHTNLLLTIYDGLRYNYAPMMTTWKKRFGTVVSNPEEGTGEVNLQANVKNTIIWEGNSVLSIDPYNFTFDFSIKPSDLPSEGEFAGYTDLLSEFRLRQLFAREEAFGWDNLIKNNFLGGGANINGSLYYTNSRSILSPHFYGDGGAKDGASWGQIFAIAENRQVPGTEHIAGQYAVTRFFIHIPAGPFGLTSDKADNEYRIWEFLILNDNVIISAKPMPQAHGYLPFSVAHSLFDRTMEAMTFAERMVAMQNHESFELNAHTTETRRSVNGGILAYDDQVFPSLSGDSVDVTGGGKAPAINMKEGDDIRKKIAQINADPRINDLAAALQVSEEQAQAILPSSQANQVAGLDRATQFQAAAVVQSASRQNLIIARQMDTTALIPSRHMQHRNLLAFGQPQEIVLPTGEVAQANPAEWRNAQLEFTTASGLRGLDRLTYILHMKELMALIIQNQQAAQQFDVVEIINYLSQLFGDYTDFNQFRLESPIDGLSPEEKQIAFALFQQAQSGQSGQPPAQ